MGNLLAFGAENSMSEFVGSILTAVTGEITLTMIATVIGAIIAAGITVYFAWFFGRKGYRFIMNSLKGKSGKI